MTRGVTLTLALTLVWVAGATWYYDCKVKRVCGPDTEVQATPVAAETVPEAVHEAPAPLPETGELNPDEILAMEPESPAPVVAPTSGEPAERSETAASAPKPASSGIDMLLLRVRFDPKSAEPVLPADAEQSLATLRGLVAEGAKLKIVGHSDSRGERARITIVSRQRAEMLRDWLVARGVPAAAVASIESEDDRVPLASNDTAEGRARNRRAEVWLQPE